MIKPLAAFVLGIAVVVLSAAAFQLSPVDVEQNNRLSTIEAYLWSTPTQEWYVTPSPSATFFNATNTYTPAASPTRQPPTPTFVPTSSAPTSTTIPLMSATPTLAPLFTRTPSPTALPDMVMAGNVSGASLWVRECAKKSCEILARVLPGEFVAVDPSMISSADGYDWVGLWNNDSKAIGGWVAFRQISPPVRYLRW